MIIPTGEMKPQKRYGHIMVYLSPYLIVHGGVMKDLQQYSSDLWIINLDEKINEEYYEWKRVEFDKDSPLPPPRMYHTAGICKSGRAKGMIIIFGGRNDEKMILNDAWGLRRHRNGKWDWVRRIINNIRYLLLIKLIIFL
jgi:protein phosphatase